MAKKQVLTSEVVRQLLDYQPDTGVFLYKERPLSMFSETPLSKGSRPASWACNKFNTRFAGKPPTQVKMSGGHLQVTILGGKYLAHRLAWLWMTGEWPKHNIDHIDGRGWNNSFSNLRDVPQQENCRNSAIHSHNTSGVMGVGYYKATGKWRADIKLSGKQKFLGYFFEKESAIAARKAAEIEYGFHANHGRTSDALDGRASSV